MSWKLLQFGILKRVVADAGNLFTTKDISEDERVRSAHPDLVHRRNYHSFVGAALSNHHIALSIVKVQTVGNRGMKWRKQGS